MEQQIEGVPVGTKLVGIREPRLGEFYILGEKLVATFLGGPVGVKPIVEPDNVYGNVALGDVAISEGYERAGDGPEEWFREPSDMEYYLSSSNLSAQLFEDEFGLLSTEDQRRIILRKKVTKKRFVVAEVVAPNGYYPLYVEVEFHKAGHSFKSGMSYRIEEREA